MSGAFYDVPWGNAEAASDRSTRRLGFPRTTPIRFDEKSTGAIVHGQRGGRADMPTIDANTPIPMTDRQNPLHAFRLILAGDYEPIEELSDTLFEAGCDDAAFGVSAGVPDIAFARERPTLRDAIESAIEDVDRAGTGLRVVRVEMDDRPTQDQLGVIGTVNAMLDRRHQGSPIGSSYMARS